MNRIDVGRAAQAACVLEAVSAKPGNVNPSFDFADTKVEDFLLSAVMIGHSMEKADRNSVGKTVLSSLQATQRVAASNTNLGIILLLAPLAKAYGKGDLRTTLRHVLQSLTIADALLVCKAIRLAHPGGLGSAPAQDVADDPTVTLLELMNMARERDAVAREYATDFAITFEVAYPALDCHLKQGADFLSSIVQAYLAVLAEVPDTLISRKRNLNDARGVSQLAADVLRAGGMASDRGKEELRRFDTFLRSEGNSLNPGATADLITAAVFTYFLQHGLDAWQRLRGQKAWDHAITG